MRFFPLWFVFLFAFHAACAQDTLAVVRLRQQLGSATDTSRVRILNSLCYQLHDQAPLRAMHYGEQAAALARSTADSLGLMRALLNLGSCYGNLSDGPQALRMQQEALQIARRLRNADGLVRAYAGMGSIHHERGDTLSAMRNYQQALQRVREPGVSTRTQLMLYGNLGSIYSFMGQYQKGLTYTRDAMFLARRSGDKAGESMYVANLGSYYLQQQRYEVAEGLLRKALSISEPLHAPRYETSQLEMLATVLLLTNHLDEAEELTRKALRKARSIGYQERVLDAYDLLANINVSRRQYEQAYGWRQLYLGLNDTLNNRARLNTLTALQTRYETHDKENQIQLLTQQGQLQRAHNRELWVVVGALVLGLMGAGVFYGKLRRSQQALAANNAALARATEQTRQLAASKDRLYSIVAHDLRGPVTSFVGVTELIDFYLRTGDEKGLKRLPQQVRQSAQSLNNLLDNLLSWAVTQTGELIFQPEPLAVAPLLEGAVELHRTTAEARQVTVTTTDPEHLSVLADVNMTRTILRNLLANALKFTPVGGAIQLTAEASPDGRSVTLAVTDTGPGIPPEQLKQLRSAEPAAGRPVVNGARSGTGLGLPLCRAFAQRHGGALDIRSTPGHGTQVRVQLPRAVA
ncbi:tetratricopeptide repeat protein [Hymenobacter busanensis]|uniref:histidine kinase n=1 Tax=Hymenobacter busanensis TaxID=2607656 RepID=A0A7L4ZZJ1_9BACT|nr:ATP-binding protein [Hymenobacter busanensis]KAA9331524.1 tetratricopeptide repeat protein [Hymenobacter busanensis]QHJ08678.1 tetratricopeptide repeat protein [Hymenobacter busanensis]